MTSVTPRYECGEIRGVWRVRRMIIADVGLGMILGSVTLLGWQMRGVDATSTVGIQPYKSR